MNVSDLEQLVALVQGAHIGELTLRHNGARVTIRKSPPAPVYELDEVASPEGKEDGYADVPLTMVSGLDEPDTDDAVPVTSPLVGTFRPAKNPVELGALVHAGQVVGIIEAMKLPNEVVAPCAGKVVEVLAENGQFVEYGQELFALQPQK